MPTPEMLEAILTIEEASVMLAYLAVPLRSRGVIIQDEDGIDSVDAGVKFARYLMDTAKEMRTKNGLPPLDAVMEA